MSNQPFKFLTDVEFDALSLAEQSQYLVAAQQRVQMIQGKLSNQLQAVARAQREMAILAYGPKHSSDSKTH